MPAIYQVQFGPINPFQFTVAGAGSASASVNVVRGLDASVPTVPVSTVSSTVEVVPSPAGWGEVDDLAVIAQGDNTLTVRFTQVADDLGAAAKYNIRYRSPTITSELFGASNPYDLYIDTNLAAGVTKDYQILNLLPGTAYGVQVLPFRGTSGAADAFGSHSNVATGTTTSSAQLGTITNLSAGAGDSLVGLSWTPAANATTHQPQYKLQSSGTWTNFGSALGGSASSVTVTSLSNDSPYNFRVVAGNGSTTTISNVASATPFEPSGEWRANEPAGFTQIVDHNGDQIPGVGWVGPFQQVGSLTVESGATPSGDGQFLHASFPVGFDYDDSATSIWYPFPVGQQPKEVYCCLYLRVSSNFLWTSSFSKPGNRFFDYGPGGASANFHAEAILGETEAGDVRGQPFRLSLGVITGAPGVAEDLGSMKNNISGGFVQPGQFALYEYRLKREDPAGANNGEYEGWVNGTRVAFHNGVRYGNTGGNGRWTHTMWDINRGLNGPLTQSDSIDIDRLYVSGKDF
jgi:hypothetical protein